jgi:hypothetical protein
LLVAYGDLMSITAGQLDVDIVRVTAGGDAVDCWTAASGETLPP